MFIHNLFNLPSQPGPGKQLKAMMRRIDQNAWNKMITLEK